MRSANRSKADKNKIAASVFSFKTSQNFVELIVIAITDGKRPAAAPHAPWITAPVVAMAAFMEVLDISIANVALQHIAGSMAASRDESTWILTSYLVTNAIILPISGWLSSVVGRKRFYMGCIAGFGASSLLCGSA